MITFHKTMDPQSLDVKQNGKLCSLIQWHDQQPRISIYGSHIGQNSFTLSEMKQIINRLNMECLPKNKLPSEEEDYDTRV